MKAVKVESHYGISLVLDQCGKCGGLWIDRDELYKTKLGEAKRIERVDTKKLRQLTKIDKELWCPHQHARLLLFLDRSFPKSIQVDKCPICHGFWFNRGEFTSFQKSIKKRRGKRITETSQEMENKVKRILDQDKKPTAETAVDRLGRFIAVKDYKPIKSTASSTAKVPLSKHMTTSVSDYYYTKRELKLWFDRYIITVQAVVMIIHLLLRLMLRK